MYWIAGVKPKPAPKPNVAPKPGHKPGIPTKPKSPVPQKPKLIDDEEFSKDNLFSEDNETDIFGKDTKVVRDVSDVDLFSLTTDASTGLDNVGADDILKYIEANEEKKEDELELFS